MIDQTWMKFISTGSVRDYLNYKNCFQSEETGKNEVYTTSDSDGKSRSVKGHGADHSVDGDGVICNSDRGI